MDRRPRPPREEEAGEAEAAERCGEAAAAAEAAAVVVVDAVGVNVGVIGAGVRGARRRCRFVFSPSSARRWRMGVRSGRGLGTGPELSRAFRRSRR